MSNETLPWTTLGEALEESRQQLEQVLQGSGAQLSYLEITCYQQWQTGEKLRKEYNLTWGEVGKRFLPDDQIPDEPSDDATRQPGEEVSQTDEQSALSDQVDGMLQNIREELVKKLSAYQTPNYKLIPGVRALITYPNPGTSCAGLRCEYDTNRQGWFWRKYSKCQGGQCCKRWTNTACA